jgi:hypothetical protein
MKLILISLLLSIGIQAMAQQATTSKIRTRISDDGNALSIQIDGTRNGQKIHYDQTFDVADMNGLQKDILKYRVLDSVGAPLPIHEMSRVIGLAFGFLTLAITFLIVRFQMRRTPRFS